MQKVFIFSKYNYGILSAYKNKDEAYLFPCPIEKYKRWKKMHSAVAWFLRSGTGSGSFF